MKREVLLFGFDQLPEIIAAQAAAGPFGAEVRVVPPRDWSLTMGQIAAGRTAGGEAAPAAATGRMAVLCGVEDCVGELAQTLTRAGVACPKAVLTDTNRNWKPETLLAELCRERDAFARRKK